MQSITTQRFGGTSLQSVLPYRMEKTGWQQDGPNRVISTVPLPAGQPMESITLGVALRNTQGDFTDAQMVRYFLTRLQRHLQESLAWLKQIQDYRDAGYQVRLSSDGAVGFSRPAPVIVAADPASPQPETQARPPRRGFPWLWFRRTTS